MNIDLIAVEDDPPEKWVRVGRWGGADEARAVVRGSIERARS